MAIRIPKEWAGARFYFEKVTDRSTWDFALVNVAAAVKTDAGGTVANSRIALGGVAATPRRCGVAEQTIKGQKVDQKPGRTCRQVGDAGRAPAQLQRLQDPALGEPGHARRAGRASLTPSSRLRYRPARDWYAE